MAQPARCPQCEYWYFAEAGDNLWKCERCGAISPGISTPAPGGAAPAAPASPARASAATQLGDLLAERGQFDLALAEYRKGAVEGDIEAMFKLGMAYLSGKGVARDPVEAYVWIKRAADAGHAGALTMKDLVAQEAVAQPRTGVVPATSQPYATPAQPPRAADPGLATANVVGETMRERKQQAAGCGPYLAGLVGIVAVFAGREVAQPAAFVGSKEYHEQHPEKVITTPHMEALADARDASMGGGVAAIIIAWLVLGGMSGKTHIAARIIVPIVCGIAAAALAGYLQGKKII